MLTKANAGKGERMSDPRIEGIKREVCAEFGVPLDYFEKLLALQDGPRRGLMDKLRQETVRTANLPMPEAGK